MAIDKILIKRKITLIAEDLTSLKEIADLSLEKYLADHKNEILAERYLERIIGRMIDINYHLITETGHTPPRDYFSSFIQLGKMKIIPVAESEKLALSAGLRNRLAHEYDAIDEKQIYAAVKVCFKDIPAYLKNINSFIKAKH
jgi:uncharacterized protein YutE (UPF0331/DUF86 family)